MLQLFYASIARADEGSAILGELSKILDYITNFNPGLLATVVGVVEFILRIVKSDKPLSLLIFAGQLLRLMGNVFIKLSELLDKILPERMRQS